MRTRRNHQRPPLYRINYIDRKIQSRQYPNSSTLASELEVSRRTILRDLDFLRDSFGAPLAYSNSKKGFYYTEEGYSLSLLKLTEGELIAVYLSHNLLLRCEGTPFQKAVASALQKICSLLPEAAAFDFGEIAETVTFDLEPLRGDETRVAAHFARLGAAIIERKSLCLDYYSISKDERRKRVVDPYRLRYYQGAWYLVAYCHLRDQMRIFALDRIQTMSETGRSFELIPDFKDDEYFADSFQLFKGPDVQAVRLWFDEPQARWVKEKRWHPSQKVFPHADGSITLELTVSGLDKLKQWILGFGSGARVLSPIGLQEEIRKELAQALAQYDP